MVVRSMNVWQGRHYWYHAHNSSTN